MMLQLDDLHGLTPNGHCFVEQCNELAVKHVDAVCELEGLRYNVKLMLCQPHYDWMLKLDSVERIATPIDEGTLWGERKPLEYYGRK